MNKKNIFIFLGLSALFLTACNTMEGMGRDIKAGGRNLEKSAKENKPN
ncbi:putative small secreted protein [Candidatus Megaera venefica]|jgi:predicted small secreted protein|uniref:Small secreted protein n=1 Tax=Candidatus Megaera venefica TaxID=2055910 RepID=A0ABU5NAM8_9RICK|nr:entericidin A/B family lipoprotein [Candidatus Megaera venefica]MEA0970220.1 putative small secreted protein [Candidatus Megaera venefica]